MKKLVAVMAVVMLILAMVAPSFAQQPQAPKGTEGPDSRKQEPKGTEGPGTRKSEEKKAQ